MQSLARRIEVQHFLHSEGQAFTFSINQPGRITTLVQRFGEAVHGGVRDMVLVEGSGWPHTHAPPVSASEVLSLVPPSLRSVFYKYGMEVLGMMLSQQSGKSLLSYMYLYFRLSQIPYQCKLAIEARIYYIFCINAKFIHKIWYCEGKWPPHFLLVFFKSMKANVSDIIIYEAKLQLRLNSVLQNREKQSHRKWSDTY